MSKTSMRTRNEVIAKQAGKYQKGTKKQKGAIATTVTEATGLSRDRARRLLAKGECPDKPRSVLGIRTETRGRKRIYDNVVLDILIFFWYLLSCVCSKRLVAALPDLLEASERFEEIEVTPEAKEKLLNISPSTVDRLLAPERKKNVYYTGRSTTKPGSLLKQEIPIRLGTEWDDAVPGFLEIDLVAHCGHTVSGEFVYTLDTTDIKTGWTEMRAVVNRAQRHVHDALKDIRGTLPFPLRGIDSDNGGEFINDQLYRYCDTEDIKFTRGRPYHKNDGCHIEEKNWSVVRRYMGYARFEGKHAVNLMNMYYVQLGLLTNFFTPQTHLLFKEVVNDKFKKTYDEYKTPYKRVLESDNVSFVEKQRLKRQMETLNPIEIQRNMDEIMVEIKKVAIPYGGQNET